MAVYGYARVSTVEQAATGNSLDTQRSILSGVAQSEGMEIGRMFVDRGVSGSKPLEDRGAGSELLSALEAGDVVFCAKLDRMFRNASDALATLQTFKDKGVRLFLKDMGGDVTGNGVSALVFTILAGVAQFERERIAERVAENRERLVAAGRFVGGRVPFGMRVVDGEDEQGRPARFLEPDPEKEPIVDRVQGMRSGGATVRAVQTAIQKEFGERIALATISKLSTA